MHVQTAGTALMAITKKKNEEIVGLLLQKGVNIVNKNNLSQSIEHTCLTTVFCVVYIEETSNIDIQ